jgi:phosphohistidine phosphatase SixA
MIRIAKGCRRTADEAGAGWRLDLGGIAVFLLAMLGLALPPSAVSAEPDNLFQALGSPGHVALLRHATAPGTGDPAGFVIDDCLTQRNLSAGGRDQAVRIGERLRAHGIETADVHSSQWCRCLETARLLDLGEVEEQPLLNSFFRRADRRVTQTEGLKAWLSREDLDRPMILVTHQVNISALAGVYPTSGELVVLRRADDGAMSVIGTIEPE